MSTQATIRNIPPGANIGMVYREELPADVKRLEMKYCEQCGISFVRKFAPTTERLAVEFDIGPLGWGHKKCQVMRRRDHGERYCRKCRYAPVPELRVIVGERLLKLHRYHLGTEMREAGLEVSIYRGALPAASSAALAAQLLGRHTSPTQAAVRAQRILRLQEALNTLAPMDLEVLSLRHFEELTAAETARVLGIEESAAAKRYFRALKRLKEILAAMPGGQEGI